jgi:type I restriction enzyme, S subunit
MEQREGYKKTAVGWIPEDWEVKRYKEVLNEVNRPYLWDDNREYHLISVRRRNGGCFFRQSLRGNQIKTKTLRPIQKNDFIISKMQVVHGATSIVPENFDGMFVSSSYIIMDAKPDLNIHYINFWAQMPRFYQDVLISSHGVHIEKMTFKLSSFLKLFMPLPPLPEQQKIASILATVDDKISSIDSQIQQTEQLKKGLMEKLLAEGIGHTEFKETEIGRIPVGWDDKKIGELVIFSGGSQPPRRNFIFEQKEGYVRLIQIRDYKTDKFKTYVPISSTKKFCNKKDIMIGRYGPPIFQILRGIDGAYNVALIKCIPQKEIMREYLWYFLKQKKLFYFIENLSQRSSGQTGVDMELLKKYPLPLPPLQEQKQIATILSTVDDKLDILNQKKSNYQTLKKGLSQQLLTGQMRVKV